VIGVLSPISAALAARNMEALRQGLRELGYVEGRNIAFEFCSLTQLAGTQRNEAARRLCLVAGSDMLIVQ
jgi:hypothetical protein